MKKTIFVVALLTAVLTLAIGSCVSTEEKELIKKMQQEEQDRPIARLVWEGSFYAYQFEVFKNPSAYYRRLGIRYVEGGRTMYAEAGSISTKTYGTFTPRLPNIPQETIIPLEGDIDRAISAYEAALNQWPGKEGISCSFSFGSMFSLVDVVATRSEVQALLESARNAKQQWLTVEKPQREQALADARQQQQGPNNPDDFDIMQNAQGTITIRGYTGTRTNVIIPETISGIRVTAIANDAFSDKSLLSVVIPNTVTSIGNRAFRRNSGLSSVVLPNAITEIGEETFSSCSALQSITIPNSVTVIRKNAFWYCGLTSVTLSSRLETIEEKAFERNKITSIQIPASLKTIGAEAFINNLITNLVIPENVIELGNYSFGSNPLSSLVIPASLARLNETTTTTQMGPGVSSWSTRVSGGFRGAFSAGGRPNETLTRVTLPANVDDINMAGGYIGNSPSYNPNFEDSLINFYRSQNKRAGTYVKENRIWRVQ